MSIPVYILVRENKNTYNKYLLFLIRYWILNTKFHLLLKLVNEILSYNKLSLLSIQWNKHSFTLAYYRVASGAWNPWIPELFLNFIGSWNVLKKLYFYNLGSWYFEWFLNFYFLVSYILFILTDLGVLWGVVSADLQPVTGISF